MLAESFEVKTLVDLCVNAQREMNAMNMMDFIVRLEPFLGYVAVPFRQTPQIPLSTEQS